MHLIEPYERWRELYAAEEDPRSPFYGRTYSETECENTIYNYYIHPQWDEFGSSTLYCKIIYAEYVEGFAIIELMGEWNDCLYNDIMYLKRDLADALILEGITKFILIGENVLNFHYSDDSYYEEWFEDVGEGWIVCMNFRDYVLQEMKRARIDYFVMFGEMFQNISWRVMHPKQLYALVSERMRRLIG